MTGHADGLPVRPRRHMDGHIDIAPGGQSAARRTAEQVRTLDVRGTQADSIPETVEAVLYVSGQGEVQRHRVNVASGWETCEESPTAWALAPPLADLPQDEALQVIGLRHAE